MQPLTLNSNFNSGYYLSNHRLNQIPLECDSPDNNKSSSNSPQNYSTTKSSIVDDRSDSPICEIQPSSQLKNTVFTQTIQYLNVANLTKNLSNSKMSKINQQINNNQENNINKHNINNNSSSSSIEKQKLLTPIVKFRRLLTSIYLHANDISNETGDRAHSLILGLISSTCSIDDFQTKIQELINYPLRSHIINFIRTCLPSIQTEIANLARLKAQSIVQFVKQNESVFLVTNLNNHSLSGSNTLVDLDELLLTTSIANQQLKRRYSPDFLLDNENQFNTSNKRIHSLYNQTASPTINLNSSTSNQTSINHQQKSSHSQTNTHQTISQSAINQQQSNTSKPTINSSSILTNTGSTLANSNILQNHLTQARTLMLEELMSNRFHQTPIQQQFNLINQHLNQKINGAHKMKQNQQQSSLMQSTNANGITNGLNNMNSMSNQLTNGGSSISNQMTTNQLNSHLQANLLLNNPLNLSKQQLERLALLERYEMALQSKSSNSNNSRSTLESNLANPHSLRANILNPSGSLAQQQNQLVNSTNLSNLSSSISNATSNNQRLPNNQSLNKQKSNSTNQSSNEMNNEEWKTIDTMLNCIISMVEKTKAALNVIQQKNQENLIMHQREQESRVSPVDWQQHIAKIPTNKNDVQITNRQLTLTPPVNLDSDFMIKSNNKDQLFSSLNISTPKMSLNRINAQTDLMSIEKNKIERIFNTLGRQAQDLFSSVQEDSLETCWNCGRKATETCSGCNEARYCGAFCQTRHWKNDHHLICGKNSIVACNLTSTMGGGDQLNDNLMIKNLRNELVEANSSDNQKAVNIVDLSKENQTKSSLIKDGLKKKEISNDDTSHYKDDQNEDVHFEDSIQENCSIKDIIKEINLKDFQSREEDVEIEKVDISQNDDPDEEDVEKTNCESSTIESKAKNDIQNELTT